MPNKANGFTNTVTRWLPISLIIAVIFYYFWYLYQFAPNIPLGDDIYDVLLVMSNLVQSEDWRNTLQIFYNQHNDHRTTASRLAYYGAYLVQGEINFRTLNFLSNFALPLLLGLLYLRVRHQRYHWWLLLPSALLLFQLRSYGITFWSMAAFAYFYVFLYGFLCLFCLHEANNSRFFLAVVFAALANFTLASGQIIWLVGLVSLLHQSVVLKQLPKKYALYWIIIGMATLALWQSGLVTPLTPQLILSNILKAPLHHIHYYFALLGSVASEKNVALATASGCAIFVALLVITVKSFRTGDTRLELCCWYIALSVAAMVLGRAHFTDVEYALTSRYSFPSVLLLCAMWVLIAVRLELRSPVLLAAIVLVAGVYAVTSYRMYSGLLQPYLDLRVKSFNNGNYPAWTRQTKDSNKIVADAVSLGLYTPPPRPYPMLDATLDGKKRPAVSAEAPVK